jgi:hypothetical protein
MPTLDELKATYNAKISRFRGLELISVPINCTQRIDLGFSKKGSFLIANWVPCLAGKRFGERLYVHGAAADDWLRAFASDRELCNALTTLLDGYAYRLEWTGSTLTARVNTMRGTITGDATGGERFFRNLAVAAERLGVASGRQELVATHTTVRSLGPATLRKVGVAAAFVVPFSLLLVLHYALSHH